LYPTLRILGCTSERFAAYCHSCFFKKVLVVKQAVGPGPAYAKAIGGIIKKHDVTLLLPVNSQEVRALLKYKHLLHNSLWYMGDFNSFCILDDKKRFSQLLQELKLPHPRIIHDLKFRGRAVIKPCCGSSSKEVAYVKNDGKEPLSCLKTKLRNGKYLLQEFIAGEGVGYSGYFRNGQIKIGYAHRRMAEFPISGGSSVLRERYRYHDKKKLRALVSSVLKKVSWSGFAMFEFKRTQNGKLVFIECNPRIWGSIHQGLAEGTNYFEFLLGPSPRKASTHKLRVRTELFPLSWLALMQYLFSGRLGHIVQIKKGRISKILDVSPTSDPFGFLSLCLRIIKKK
jgi:hypothetical protein